MAATGGRLEAKYGKDTATEELPPRPRPSGAAGLARSGSRLAGPRAAGLACPEDEHHWGLGWGTIGMGEWIIRDTVVDPRDPGGGGGGGESDGGLGPGGAVDSLPFW